MTYFPDHVIPSAGDYSGEYFSRLATAAASIDAKSITAAGELLATTVQRGGRVYSCGNGGSAAIANHLVCDCLKGIRTNTELRPKVYSLSSTVELITAIVNDINAQEMFAYQLESLAEKGDILIAISSSGASPNIVRALEVAKSMEMKTICFTGFSGLPSRNLADVNIHVDCENYGVIEDLHQSLMHILAQFTRHKGIAHPFMLGNIKF